MNKFLKPYIAKMLTDGETVSGQEIADRLGVTRAAVWKAIRALREEGYDIRGRTGSGYYLADCDVLTPSSIAACITDYREKFLAKSADNVRNRPLNIFCLKTVDSTNNEAKRLLAGGETYFLVTAESQTQGRGRMGRGFYSPSRTGAYFTLAMSGERSYADAVKLTSLAAVAVCRAVENLTDARPMIKWVNDVYVDGRKICGILTEAAADVESGTASNVIIGIGVNISTENFPEDAKIAGSLNADVSRKALVGAVAAELTDMLGGADGAAYMDYYRSHSLVLGKEVEFTRGGVKREGVAVSVDDDGALTVETDDGPVKLASGEISLKLAR